MATSSRGRGVKTMTLPLIVESAEPPVSAGPFEIVERKGLGHPDTICDAVMESVAVRLAQAYAQTAGRILHFNADKALLVAGQAEYRFGGGRLLKPMRLVMGDRATWEWDGTPIPVAEIAIQAAARWFTQNLPKVSVGRDLLCQVELQPAPPALRAVAEHQFPLANDTSASVGYAPLTATERLVLQAESFLNGRSFKQSFPDTGQDVKVLAVRKDRDLTVTVAMPFFAPMLRNEREYFRRKSAAERALAGFVERRTGGRLKTTVNLNVLDSPGEAESGAYLTLLGTSAEAGDSGEVGRGNRVSRVISLRRPAGAEATAGKHPLSHVGKIYNVFSQTLDEHLHRRVSGLEQVTVWMTSRIGTPVAEPDTVVVEVTPRSGRAFKGLLPGIQREVAAMLATLPSFCVELARGRYAVC
jgi:S-adenosylmethionine synthetase